MNQIARKDISFAVRLKMAIGIRDFTDAAKPLKNKYSVEVFNNTNVFRDPDRIGITIVHPSFENATHVAAETFPLSMGERAFTKQVQRMEKELEKRIGNR